MRLFISLFCLASGLAAADATYDGARVHYETYGKGTEAVVFIHGWTCDLTFWRGQAPVYEKRRALLIDLPGHGQSDKPKVDYTQERFARAIEAVMRDAKVERADLVVHSMGGAVGLAFVRLFPAKAKSLVLVDAYVPQAPKDEAEGEKQKAQMEPFLKSFEAPNYKDTMARMIDGMFSANTTAAQKEEIRAKMMATPQHVLVPSMRGMFAIEAPKTGETHDLPVMAIVTPTQGRMGYEARVRAVFPNLKKYELWEGAGHFLMMESPDRFNRALEEFLAAR